MEMISLEFLMIISLTLIFCDLTEALTLTIIFSDTCEAIM